MKDEGQRTSNDLSPGFYFLLCDVPECTCHCAHVAGSFPGAGLLGSYIYLGSFQNMGII